MEILKEKIIKINKKYGGCPLNISNLDFDLDMANHEKNIYKKNAYLIRGIVCGHSFSDGCKSTAMDITVKNFTKENIKYNKKKMVRGLVKIAESKPTIKQIESKLRKWCK